MPTFEHTVEIAAPVDRVYEFGLDPDNWLRANPAITDIRLLEETDDELRAEATYDLFVTTVDGEIELTIVEPYAHTVARLDSPGLTGEVHYRFSETDGGTELVQVADYRLVGPLVEQLVEPVAERYARRRFASYLENSRDLIEATAGEPAGT